MNEYSSTLEKDMLNRAIRTIERKGKVLITGMILAPVLILIILVFSLFFMSKGLSDKTEIIKLFIISMVLVALSTIVFYPVLKRRLFGKVEVVDGNVVVDGILIDKNRYHIMIRYDLFTKLPRVCLIRTKNGEKDDLVKKFMYGLDGFYAPVFVLLGYDVFDLPHNKWFGLSKYLNSDYTYVSSNLKRAYITKDGNLDVDRLLNYIKYNEGIILASGIIELLFGVLIIVMIVVYYLGYFSG